MTEIMRKFTNKVVGYVVWVLLIILSFSLIKNLDRVGQINKQIKAEKAKIAKIKSDNDKLLIELAQTQTPDFMDKAIRDKLGLGKEGEAIVVLPDEEILRKLAPQIKTEENYLPDPNWKKWEKLFF